MGHTTAIFIIIYFKTELHLNVPISLGKHLLQMFFRLEMSRFSIHPIIQHWYWYRKSIFKIDNQVLIQ